MRKLGRFWQLSILPALGLALLSSDVNASASTASGTLCRLLAVTSGVGIAYGTVGAQNSGSGPNLATFSCPVPMDDVALGSSVNFRVRVYNNSSTDVTSCTPFVNTENGGTAKTAAAKSTPAGSIGTFTLTGTGFSPWPGSVPGNVNTNMYAVQCTLPPGSVVYSVRAQ